MKKILRFKKAPTLKDLEGLSVNGGTFENGDGCIQKNTIVMDVPNTFRFSTKIEVYTFENGVCDLIMSQFLTRGPEYWEMGDSFRRIGFRNPEIETQFRVLCETLVNKDLVYWAEE